MAMATYVLYRAALRYLASGPDSTFRFIADLRDNKSCNKHLYVERTKKNCTKFDARGVWACLSIREARAEFSSSYCVRKQTFCGVAYLWLLLPILFIITVSRSILAPVVIVHEAHCVW